MPDPTCGHLVWLPGETHPHPCGRAAICHVTYFLDGSGGQHACRQHRNAAIVEVAAALTVGGRASLKYTPLGVDAERIERQYHRNRRASEM